MNHDEKRAAFRLYLAFGDGGDSATRSAFESTPGAVLDAIDGANLWPDVLWSLVTRLVVDVDNAQARGERWQGIAADTLDNGMLALGLAHDSVAQIDRVVNARTRARQRQAAERRSEILRLKAEGKSIAYTADRLGLSLTTVARVRGKAKGDARHP